MHIWVQLARRLTACYQGLAVTLNLLGGSQRAIRDRWQLPSTRCKARGVLPDAGSHPPLITTPATCCHSYNIQRLAVTLKLLSGFYHAARGRRLLLTCRYSCSMPLDYPQVTAMDNVVPTLAMTWSCRLPSLWRLTFIQVHRCLP